MNKITLALTHYNRFDLLLEAVRMVRNDSRLREIIISDDASTDGSYERLIQEFEDHPKVCIHRNSKNVDCYRNKRRAVELSSSEWVILFDSDNILPESYLDVLYSIPRWDPDCIYCPEMATPHFDYTAFSGTVVTKSNVAKLMERPHFATALNTANYFLPKDPWLSVWDGTRNPYTADTIFQAYNWLRAGKKLVILPRLRYFHRVHGSSHYKLNCHKTGSQAKEIEQRLKELK